MGGCASSIDDHDIAGTTVTEINNGTEEASLIFNGNMKLSSKVTVHHIVDFNRSFHLNVPTFRKWISPVKVIPLLLYTCKMKVSNGMKLEELRSLQIHKRNHLYFHVI